MKIKIAAKPGELEAKAADVIRVIEKLTGRDLVKAQPTPPGPGESIKPQLEYAALRGTVKRSEQEVRRVGAIMQAKFAEILKG